MNEERVTLENSERKHQGEKTTWELCK